MRNTVVIEVNNVFLTDFDSKLPAPALIESSEGGVRILFDNIDDLKNYQESLIAEEGESAEAAQRNEVISKINKSLNQAVRDNHAVVDAIKAFANVLFYFIFDADAHRQDKLMIFEAMIAGIRETTNSLELEDAIQETTYELGVLAFNHKITFYNFAHNHAEYSYEKIKNRLIKDLLVLKLSLTGE